MFEVIPDVLDALKMQNLNRLLAHARVAYRAAVASLLLQQLNGVGNIHVLVVDAAMHKPHECKRLFWY